ncbi:GntR family transcriptional regulator [Peptostreptococcus stomatis]|uniref:GntR family transcriptional regulator n=1 Tax=Peptostreptococcus stomatis TaxID=341694 RepID=UPI0028E76341|nr:GntR family transcriptional regulator [Peptostreptococcus stomatis]
MKEIKFNNNSPIYLQISKYFESRVFLGELEPGSLIPSRRELAGLLGVNLNTVQKAYSYMDEIGLIITEKSKGSVITSDLDKLKDLREDYIKEPLIDFIASMKSINIPKDKVIDLLDQYYDEIKEDLTDDTSAESNKKI